MNTRELFELAKTSRSFDNFLEELQLKISKDIKDNTLIEFRLIIETKFGEGPAPFPLPLGELYYHYYHDFNDEENKRTK